MRMKSYGLLALVVVFAVLANFFRCL